MTAVDSFIRAVEARLRDELARTPIAAPAGRLLEAGGKRLRARLLWWSASASAPRPLDPEHHSLVRAATAIELAHLGSLVHDDIVDGGDTRRGVATLHRAHGVRVATDAGAALAHLATELVAPLGTRARHAVRRALLATCRGQVRELAVPFVVVPPRYRLAIMREKTGAFFELAAALGAVIAEADRRAGAAVRRFARRFGVAFQIADDVLDLAGDPRELGRANGADLRDGVVTLPVLLAADPQHALRRTLDRIRIAPDTDTVASCAELVTRGGGTAAARTVAAWWLGHAVAALHPLRSSDDVAALTALARASVERGLRAGTPSFVASAHAGGSAPHLTTPLIETAEGGRRTPTSGLDPRLVHVLEWFHPGLAAMVATRANDPGVDTIRGVVRDELRRGHAWSPEAGLAADAIALAHAMAGDEALHRDPVRTLAVVDTLHCAGIGFLASTPGVREHARMAARARDVFAHGPRATEPMFASSHRDPSLASASPA